MGRTPLPIVRRVDPTAGLRAARRLYVAGRLELDEFERLVEVCLRAEANVDPPRDPARRSTR